MCQPVDQRIPRLPTQIYGEGVDFPDRQIRRQRPFGCFRSALSVPCGTAVEAGARSPPSHRLWAAADPDRPQVPGKSLPRVPDGKAVPPDPQESEFTAEGSPPPGRVGTGAPELPPVRSVPGS